MRNSKKKTSRIAPLFDNGISLLSRCKPADEIVNHHIMEDKPELNKLKSTDKAIVMEGLDDVISDILQDKVAELKYILARKYAKIKSLEIENKLM